MRTNAHQGSDNTKLIWLKFDNTSKQQFYWQCSRNVYGAVSHCCVFLIVYTSVHIVLKSSRICVLRLFRPSAEYVETQLLFMEFVLDKYVKDFVVGVCGNKNKLSRYHLGILSHKNNLVFKSRHLFKRWMTTKFEYENQRVLVENDQLKKKYIPKVI